MLGGEASRGSRIKELALSCLCSHCHPSLFSMSVAPSKLDLCAAPMVGIAPLPRTPPAQRGGADILTETYYIFQEVTGKREHETQHLVP